MKKEWFKYLRSKTFRNYFFSYMGILLAVIGVLSIISIWHIIENMKRDDVLLTENKIKIIVDDLEVQMNAMRKMAIEVATLKDFRLDYVQSNKYNEIEMLDRLDDYSQVSDICDGYFLKYNTRDIVFTSAGTTLSLEVFFNNTFRSEDYADIIELIECSGKDIEERIIFGKLKDTLFFIYPLEKYAISRIGRDGVLCFLISEESIKERVNKLVGNMDGKLTLFYKDICIFDEYDYDKRIVREDTNIIELEAVQGNFRVLFSKKENFFIWKNIFSVWEITVFVIIFLILFVLGYLYAYWTLKPMHKIVEKYCGKVEEELVADWDSIDIFIESLLQGKEKNDKLLQEQFRLFREKTIQLIVAGGYSEKVQEYMTLLNIKLDASVFGIIKCTFTDSKQLEGESWEKLYNDVEKLTDEDVSVYSCLDSNRNICVLLAAEEEYQLYETMELIQALFETKELSAEVEMAGIGSDLKSINKSVVKCEDEKEDLEKRISKYNRTVSSILEYIRSNCSNCDLSLDLIAEEFQIGTTYISRIIKQETGMNYKEYLTGLRMEMAKNLLLNRNISIIDVCEKSGYSNVSYFIKIFQKYTGMTPARYRDTH